MTQSEGARRARQMLKWQWGINIASGVFSAIAIALAFANLGLLAQLAMIPVLICVTAACILAWVRYQDNRKRRDEILSQLDAERDRQLIELFDKERLQKNLPNDAQSKDGFSSLVEKMNQTNINSNLPPGVKKRGGGGNGSR